MANTAGNFSWHQALAAHDPEQVLLTSGTRRWTAGAMQREMQALRERLASSRVMAVLADNGAPWVLADLAAQDAGVVHLPLPGFFTPEQLRHALDQTAADTVLTDQPERIGALDAGFAITGTWLGLIWMQRVVEPHNGASGATLPAGTAKISFTSGSTGAPKGVCLSRDGLIDTAQAVRERLADLPLGRHLAVLPLALLLENVAGVYAPLLRGTPVHLVPLQNIGWRGMSGFNPAALDDAVSTAGAASVILVPELLKAWTAYLRLSGRLPSPALQFAAVGGARVSARLVQEARRLGIPAYQGYGLTEGGSVVTLNRPGDDGDDAGRPLDHAQISLHDGEVMVHTRAFLGYTGSSAVASGAFPSGDLGEFRADGHLQLSGRRKNLLITSFGRNVSPEWPEEALLADPRIQQAVVVGDGRPALAAIVVPLPGVPATTIDGLIADLNRQLPDYAQIAHWMVSDPFTPQNGMATGNGRPVRLRIAAHHAAAIDALYAEEECRDVVL